MESLKSFRMFSLLEPCILTLKVGVHTGQGNVRKILIFSRSGNCQGILCCVRENELLVKCQANVREFYNFQFVSTGEKLKMANPVFLTFWI